MDGGPHPFLDTGRQAASGSTVCPRRALTNAGSDRMFRERLKAPRPVGFSAKEFLLSSVSLPDAARF
jgi:hypothetical protein